MISASLACFCLIAALSLVSVNAHGGTFHPAESTPENKNYIRNKVGTCSKWTLMSSTSNAAASSNMTDVDVMGPATLWSYRYKNCSDSLSVCVEVNLTFTVGGKPLVGKNITGWTHVGSCGAAKGPGAKYQLNASVTDPEELERTWVWFHDGVTNSSGRIWGQGANDGDLSTAAPNGAKSFVLYDDASEDPIACCDFALSAPADTNWTAILPAGVVCMADDGHDSHSAHSGHDHSTMTDTMNGTMNGTMNKNASATSAGFFCASCSVKWVVGLLLVLALLL